MSETDQTCHVQAALICSFALLIRPSRVAENATSGIPSYGSFELHFVTRSVAINRACSLQEHTLHQHFLMERIPRITQDT